ncbi:hypothetical protein BO85DRAFT_36147 [Aspergillus piperis CBS 112811]|uniref:Uncharacterized protein n=3 Tax=Aspergillus subgen. Circumdati TaxID=2720871 RepID=A0A8G1R5N3_9EURO|nr:hypothetical protein BO87DRAFT_52944 [Aspergillus neoniger CBS 115656]XP_025515172.1 hypothetical protein BO85DRAFT_36147 [Aspergillus piperis CBS 112811]PYH34653.1 hypothetical protein BO87DRAFT_52944 [Aspergillus neoniger CBS 115656]RAH57250.1 hypothetical protein BO85DRAFT_36147 [Aspergillus piperis CBS 112811]
MGQRTMSDQPADQAAQIGNYQQGIPAMQQPKSVAFPFWAGRHHAETGPEQQLSPGSAIGLTPNHNRPTHLTYLGSRSPTGSGHDTFIRCYWTYFWAIFLGRNNEDNAPNATIFSVALRCGYSTDSIAG